VEREAPGVLHLGLMAQTQYPVVEALAQVEAWPGRERVAQPQAGMSTSMVNRVVTVLVEGKEPQVFLGSVELPMMSLEIPLVSVAGAQEQMEIAQGQREGLVL